MVHLVAPLFSAALHRIRRITAYPNCRWISRWSMSLVSRYSNPAHMLLVGAGTLTAISGAPRELKGAEVVIHVAATIDQLDGDSASTPIPLEVGDTITTTYIFDSAEFAADQTAALGSQKLTLADRVLESDNSASLVLNMGLILPPIDPPDTLLVSCASLTDVFPACNTNRFPENESLIWDPTLALFADPGSLETLADVRSLSSLSSIGATGTLRIEISELDVSQASLDRLLTIRATITELTVVPEPSSSYLVFTSVIFGSVMRFAGAPGS